jgi:hypothetical protein
MKITGGCLCGAVRFVAEGETAFAGNCHCRDCQRVTGSGYMPVLGFLETAVAVTGTVRFFERRGDSGRPCWDGFCPECGSRLLARAESIPGILMLQAGSLDDPSAYRPQFDVYTSSAQPWDHMDPALAKFPQMPPLG